MELNSRQACLDADADDPLAGLRTQFEIPEGLIYLDGNSLGMLPKGVSARVDDVIRRQWGQDLIRSWNRAGWMQWPHEVGNKIGRLIGAGPDEVVVADSTSINLYKVLSAALMLARQQRPHQRIILSERSNFPTDLYIAQSLAQSLGMQVQCADTPEALEAALNDQVAVLMLTHVNYRTGHMHNLPALTAAAHRVGALTLWDLAHSAGAVPVDLRAANADFAVGCGYKYLNGGPGAPAFVWVHPRHIPHAQQPLSGWIGHAQPFEFDPQYRAAAGIGRFLCGTPAILSLAALDIGVDTLLAAQPMGGMAALREKSLHLTDLFMQQVTRRCAEFGLACITPTSHAQRGSQVCLTHPEGAYAMVQALIERGVIGDFRAPNVLRFGFTPVNLRYVDVWDAVEHLYAVLQSKQWQQDRFQQRAQVT